MAPSRLPLLLALLTFGLALLSGTWAYNRTIRTVPALVAVRDIPAGAALDDSLVEIIRVPAGGTPPQALYGLGQIAGMYAAVPLFQDQIISARQISSKPPTRDGIEIGPGQRIVSIPVRPDAVLDGALRPGDVVDVAAAWNPGDSKQAPVDVIVSNVRITDLRDSSGHSGSVPTTVLLAVNATQAKALVGAVESKAALYLWLVGREQP